MLLLVVLTVTTLGACFGTPAESGGSSTTATAGNGQPSTPSEQTYTVKLVSIGGMPIAGAGVYIYADEALTDLKTYRSTDENGEVSFTLARSNSWHAVIRGVPEGYELAASYKLTAGTTRIALTSRVIADEDISDVTYSTGDIMHDFTVTTVDDETFKLSEVLKEKRAVLINFWYSECLPCRSEFPYMQQAYEEYKDQIAIIGLNHYDKDTEKSIREFAESLELTFDLAKDNTDLAYAFNVLAYPTSILIDRYGMITVIEEGAITSVKPFRALFGHVTATDYKQQVITDISALVPIEVPDVDMPSSEDLAGAFNGSDLNTVYTPEQDASKAEMSWPFLIGEGKIGDREGKYIYPANAYKDSSYATLYVTLSLKAGQALAFDYFASSEEYVDILSVSVDGKEIYQISGDSTASGWQTCYPFVALEDGEYKLCFRYVKDEGDNFGKDTVYLANLRTASTSDIKTPTYIPRYAATNRNPNGLGFKNYITAVLGDDGYYHVGSKTGPLLLVDLMGATPFSDTSLFMMAYLGNIDKKRDFYTEFLPYFSLAANSAVSGLCSVDKDLKALLEDVAEIKGFEIDNPDQWLQMCCYYNAYGTNGVELEDPVKGLDTNHAYEAQLGKNNSVTYNRVIMPRGLLYKFVPEKSGVYRITSHSDKEVDGWIFLDGREEYLVYEGDEREWTDTDNVSMVAYMEAGKAYYIDIAYYDVYEEGTFTFEISYVGESYSLFRRAAPGYFTYEDGTETEEGIIMGGDIIALGINVTPDEKGYYRELLADGTLGSYVYADLKYATVIFDKSIKDMVEMGTFNFRLSDADQEILGYLEKYGKDSFEAEMKKLWGDEFEDLWEEYQVEDVLAGTYHGPKDAVDRTEEIRLYLALLDDGKDAPEREGCVKVNVNLATILQELMDKFTFEGVENSWLKLCYYYDLLAPEAKEDASV